MPRVHFANSSPIRAAQMTEHENQSTSQEQDMLRITPSEYISFGRSENTESGVDITCINKTPVTYKIQTTSPEKFRVRPRCGVLNCNETVTVNILLKPEHQLSESSRDKFLVMSFPLSTSECSNIGQQQLPDLWKQKSMNSPDLEQHRLYCVYKDVGDASRRNGHIMWPNSLVDKSNASKTRDLQLQKDGKCTHILLYVILGILFVNTVAVAYLLNVVLRSPDDSGAYHMDYRNHGRI